jgi:hypothetical protein
MNVNISPIRLTTVISDIMYNYDAADTLNHQLSIATQGHIMAYGKIEFRSKILACE